MAKKIPWSETALWMNARVLALGGSWRPPGVRGFQVYRIWVLFTQFSFLIGQLQGLYYFWGDANRIIQDVCLLITTILGLIKFFVFVLWQDDVFKIVQTIDDVRAQQYKSENPQVTSILDSSYKSAKTITVCMAGLGGTAPLVWAVSPLIMKQFGIGPPGRELPAMAWYTSHDTETPVYQLLYVLQYFSMQYSYYAAMCLDLFFACLIIHVAAQLEVLNAKMRQIGNNSSGTATQDSTSIKEPLNKEAEDPSAWNDFLECIEHHKDAIKLVKDVERLVSPIILSQFMGATVIICVTLFLITTNHQHFAALVRLQAYLAVVVYEIFMYCWYGDDIMYQNTCLITSIYFCGWPTGPRKLRRSIMMVLLRAQRPLGLTAGKFYFVSRETFVSLMTASYSYYTLLNQVNDN